MVRYSEELQKIPHAMNDPALRLEARFQKKAPPTLEMRPGLFFHEQKILLIFLKNPRWSCVLGLFNFEICTYCGFDRPPHSDMIFFVERYKFLCQIAHFYTISSPPRPARTMLPSSDILRATAMMRFCAFCTSVRRIGPNASISS